MINSEKDGSEIKAKVLEITDKEIKYKNFDFQNGPTRYISISEVFMITYENGQKEVFNKSVEMKNESTQDVKTQSQTKQKSSQNCAKNIAFGLDIGLGGSFASITGINNYRSLPFFAPALGIRVMHHFNPYFGVDFIKINWITDVLTANSYYSYTPWQMRIQIMPGVRGNSPTFFKCMSVYTAFRLGYGMHVAGGFNFQGLCLETELGLNLTRTIFAGFTYNYHKYYGPDLGLNMHTLSFRLGINIGK